MYLILILIFSVSILTPTPPIIPHFPKNEVSSLYVTDCIEAESGNWEQIQELIHCVYGEYGELVVEISNYEKGDHVCEGGSHLRVNGRPKYWGLMQIDINYAMDAGRGNYELGLECLQDCKCNLEYSAVARAKYLDINGNPTPPNRLVNFCQWGPYIKILSHKVSTYVPDKSHRQRIPICR